MDRVKNYVRRYFNDGFSYEEILEFLKIRHEYICSLSTLKRFLRKNGLRKRPLANFRDSNNLIVEAIRIELDGSGRGMGYQRMHQALISQGIHCRREDVRKIVKELDSEGVELRRKKRLHRRKYVTKGPNYVWHIDGHDKLKPFGFSIHGCIDGFSRKVIWLEVGPSNKLPDVIAQYYLDAVSKYGCSKNIKADDGTEHTLIEPVHIALRMINDHEDNALNSFSIITSPQNQRIEAYWSILQRDRIGWWRRFFQDLADLDMFTNDPVIIECIRFCFTDIIRKDLVSIKNDWNVHIISRSRNNGTRGRPDTMYYLPHLFDTRDYKIEIDPDEFADVAVCVSNDIEDVSDEFKEFAREVLRGSGFEEVNDVTDALKVYFFLLGKIEEYN